MQRYVHRWVLRWNKNKTMIILVHRRWYSPRRAGSIGISSAKSEPRRSSKVMTTLLLSTAGESQRAHRQHQHQQRQRQRYQKARRQAVAAVVAETSTANLPLSGPGQRQPLRRGRIRRRRGCVQRRRRLSKPYASRARVKVPVSGAGRGTSSCSCCRPAGCSRSPAGQGPKSISAPCLLQTKASRSFG